MLIEDILNAQEVMSTPLGTPDAERTNVDL